MSRTLVGRFVDALPPAERGAGHRSGGARPDPAYVRAAAKCKASPYRWMHLFHADSRRGADGYAFAIRHGHGPWAGGGFEAAVRGNDLYVRYVRYTGRAT